MRAPPEISTVSGYETRVTECFLHPGKKVVISWRLISSAANSCIVVGGKQLIPNVAHRVGHSNHDITANFFPAVVKLSRVFALSLSHSLTDSGKLPLTNRALPSIEGVVDMLCRSRRGNRQALRSSRLGAFWPQGQEGRPTMPEYYFHLLEENGQNLVRDSDGTTLPDAAEARKEAIGLARDIVDHRLHKPTWQVVVTDANGVVVLAVPLTGMHPHKMKATLALARRISTYEPQLRSHIFTLLLTAAMCVMIAQATLLISISRDRAERYRVTSTRAYQASAMGSLPWFADEVSSDSLMTRYYFWRHGVGRGAASIKNH
jgi:hypothetical protein